MKKLATALAFFVLLSLPLLSQASFPRFGSIENDGIATLNHYNLGWTKSITLVSVPSRGLTFDPRLTYNSFIWQKNGSVWSPVVGDDGNPTWGWVHNGTSFQDTNITYQGYRYRCVANDGSNQWGYEYNGFQTATQSFSLDLLFAQLPDQYPECGSPGQVQSAYGQDRSGAPTGYLLSIEGIGAGLLPHPTMTLFSPGGTNVDVSGSISDTNGNHVTTNTNGNVETWTDTIGRTALTITNDTTNHLTTYAYSDSGGGSQSWTMHYTQSYIRTAFACPTTSEYAQSGIYLPTSLVLPGTNGSYTFDYEATPDPNYPGWTTGRISKITLPTGGWIQYTYSGVNCDDGSPMQVTKTINDGSTSSSWTYTRTNNGGSWTTTITTPATSAVVTFNSDGVTTDEKTYAATNQTGLLREVQQTYQNHIPQQTTISSGAVSKVLTSAYDGYGNLTSLAEYDWNSTGTPVRTTTYTYMNDPSFVSNGLVNRVTNQTVRLGGFGGTVKARTDYFYDYKDSLGNSDNDAGNIGMTCQTGAAAHDDTNYGCSGSLARGNLTKVVQYSDPGNGAGAIKTFYGYDSLGNLKQVKDPRGNSTAVSYADLWDGTSACSVSSAFAYPTVLTNALGHQQTTWYNRCIGQAAKTQDPNSKQTTLAYSDALLRQTNVSYPDGGGINYSYSTNQTSAQVIGGTNTTTTIDGIGRTTRVRTADVATDYGYGYDGQSGTTASVSNPYRGTAGPSTTTHSDALGRVTQVDYADGTSHSYTSYSNNCSSLTDAASHQRKLCFDGLGHLAQVYEDPNGLNIGTTYAYNPLDKLTDVLQNGGMARHFLYDGLSRMVAANNPENSTAANPPSQGCGTSLSWTACYSYDNNGNLTSKTDNRGVTANNYYDALNRLTSTTYSDGITPSNYYAYDVAPGWMSDNQNVVGRLANSANQFGGGTSGGSIAAAYSYDAMGRVVREWKQTPSHSPGGVFVYSGYDVAGNLRSLTYPDGRNITQSFDTNGRLSTVTYDNWNGQHIGYNYASGFSFAPSGALLNMTLGNGVQTGILYNSRQQVCQMATGFPAAQGSSTLAIAIDRHYYYASNAGFCAATAGNTGNVAIITDERNPGKSQGFGYDQLNRLTSASRSDGGFNYSYPIDPFGNMTQVNNLTGNPTVSFPSNNQMQVGGNGYTYDAAGNLVDTGQYGQHFTYDGESRISQVNQGSTASYLYNLEGQRARKDANGGWTEYFFFGGQPLAELHSDGTWSDYIYANGQKIAKADSFDIRVHFSGLNCSGCGSTNTFAGATSLTAAVGYVIRNGDVLRWRQWQGGVGSGGVGIFLNNTTATNGVLRDTDGQLADADTTMYIWHLRTVDLSAYAGQTITNFNIFNTAGGAPGNWDVYFNDISLTSTDGSVIPIYSQSMTSLTTFQAAAVSNFSGVTENIPAIDPLSTTNYFIGDHLGTAQVEFAGGGWPVWKGEFAPYGQEINPQATSNSYKFTGQERDSETGFDHFQFRSLSSTMGRWTSPDPYLGSMDLTNPQSLNRYAYVGNKPVSLFDPTGLNEAAPCSSYCWLFGYGAYGSGGNPSYCPPEYAQCYESSSGGGGGSGAGSSGDGGGGGGGSVWNDTYGVPYPGLANAIAQAINVPPLGGGCEFGTCGSGFFQNEKVHGQWYYGNWCGAGGMGTPINPVDYGCMMHDYRFGRSGADWTNMQSDANWSKLDPDRQRLVQRANQQLCDTMTGVIPTIPRRNIRELVAAKEIRMYFQKYVPEGARCH